MQTVHADAATKPDDCRRTLIQLGSRICMQLHRAYQWSAETALPIPQVWYAPAPRQHPGPHSCNVGSLTLDHFILQNKIYKQILLQLLQTGRPFLLIILRTINYCLHRVYIYYVFIYKFVTFTNVITDQSEWLFLK